MWPSNRDLFDWLINEHTEWSLAYVTEIRRSTQNMISGRQFIMREFFSINWLLDWLTEEDAEWSFKFLGEFLRLRWSWD
jgi:hypothetical protein